MKENYLEIYLNYLRSLRIREEYGCIYGDTKDIIKYYESKIKDILLEYNLKVSDCIDNKKYYKKI